MNTLTLSVLPLSLAVCLLEPDMPLPKWATTSAFHAIIRTNQELSIVCAEANVPIGVQCKGAWTALEVEGPLDFALTGILAGLATPLAAAGISIFALSTYRTDYVLVQTEQLDLAISTLSQQGHTVHQ